MPNRRTNRFPAKGAGKIMFFLSFCEFEGRFPAGTLEIYLYGRPESAINNEFSNRNNGRFSVVERQDVERLIDTEFDFQLSRFSAREKTAEMERVLNGTQILSGRIGKLGNEIRITVSLYTYPEIQRLPGGATVSVANKNELFSKIPELVRTMQNAIAGGGGGGGPPPTTGRTYSIGDIGPAGGIIFFDKGFFSNGWQYLEVTPVETEIRANLFESEIISGREFYTEYGNGWGKHNTQIVINVINEYNSWVGGVFAFCRTFNFGGYNDWYIPSMDELE